MNNLRVIENDLVPVYETSTGEKVVYGTELHTALDVRTPYRMWVERRLEECEAGENEDFEAAQICSPSGQSMKEHIIKLDTAKEMAMLERNDKGKQVRRYFIQVEKKYRKGIPQKQSTNDRFHIMEMNARSRMAQTYLKLAAVDTLSTTYKSILVAKASEVLVGEPLLPLPKSDRRVYSAKEIGKLFQISANKVGRIANQHNLKTEEYGEYRRSKSENSVKEIDTWVYFDTVIPAISKILGREVA